MYARLFVMVGLIVIMLVAGGTVQRVHADIAPECPVIEEGSGNSAAGTCPTVSGGQNNQATGSWSTVDGGYENVASGQGSTIGGGAYSQATNTYTTISGGSNHTASGYNATISGGNFGIVSDDYGTVGGGAHNRAGDNAGTLIDQPYATVGGGKQNTASAGYSTIPGGYGNRATGFFSTVGGGYVNTAGGAYSFAAGRQAQAMHAGSFVWADSTAASFASTTGNQFSVRAKGGVRFVTNSTTPATGCSIPAGGGAWACTSDRAAKANIVAVDSQSILERVAALPIALWNYRSQNDSIKHIGPMAQDFHAAFGLGENDTTISTVDADGVALAAIQGLYQDNQAKAQRIAALEQQVTALQQQSPTGGVSIQVLILAMAVTGLGAIVLSGLVMTVLLRGRLVVLPATR